MNLKVFMDAYVGKASAGRRRQTPAKSLGKFKRIFRVQADAYMQGKYLRAA